MVYKTTETKTAEVEEVIKPSDVYLPSAKEEITLKLRSGEIRIIDFRPPAVGDWFLAAKLGMEILRQGHDGTMIDAGKPRFIIEYVFTQKFWE